MVFGPKCCVGTWVSWSGLNFDRDVDGTPPYVARGPRIGQVWMDGAGGECVEGLDREVGLDAVEGTISVQGARVSAPDVPAAAWIQRFRRANRRGAVRRTTASPYHHGIDFGPATLVQVGATVVKVGRMAPSAEATPPCGLRVVRPEQRNIGKR